MKLDLRPPLKEQSLEYKKNIVDIHGDVDRCWEGRCKICENRKHNRKEIKEFVQDLIHTDESLITKELENQKYIVKNLISKITELQKVVFNVKEEKPLLPYIPQHICQDLVHMKRIKIRNGFLGWTLSVYNSSFSEDKLLDCFRIKSCPFCSQKLE